MQTLARISIFCVLCVGYVYGQDFFGVLDYDAYGLDLREEDLLKDRDIFKEDANPQHTDTTADESLKNLCNEYDVFLNNQRLDCSSIRFVQRARKIEHTVQKREADEPLEGSGDGDVENSGPEAVANLEEAKEEGEPDQQEDKVQEEEKGEPTEEDAPVVKEEENAANTEVEATESKLESPDAGEAAVEPAKEIEESETATEGPAEEENTTSAPVEDSENQTEGIVPVDVPEPGVTENPEDEETVGTTVASVVKKGRKLLPSDTETDKSEKLDENKGVHEVKPKEAENVHEHQSGNAVVEGKGATIEQDERAVNAMAPNSKIKAASSNAEEPKSGESAKDADESRKDTKVLIILFVAVVVIGGAAFAYNFIKKRKQRKAHAAREENGDGNVLKRSLQNLTGQAAKGDPEQGTEMKPLMKIPETKPVVTEYTDEKDNANTVANK